MSQQKRTQLTAAQADAKFSGVEFRFDRTKLKAKNLMFEIGNNGVSSASVDVKEAGGEWEHLKMKFREFLRDDPKLLNEK